jgi:hypothetical protein
MRVAERDLPIALSNSRQVISIVFEVCSQFQST